MYRDHSVELIPIMSRCALSCQVPPFLRTYSSRALSQICSLSSSTPSMSKITASIGLIGHGNCAGTNLEPREQQTMQVATTPIIATSELTKDYAGFRAVDGVSLAIERHRIHAIIGPNGAGKTTLFNLLSGFTPPTSGKIVFDERDITGMPAADVAQLGIVRSFQITSIFPHLSVLDNVKVSLEAKTRLPARFLASSKAMR